MKILTLLALVVLTSALPRHHGKLRKTNRGLLSYILGSATNYCFCQCGVPNRSYRALDLSKEISMANSTNTSTTPSKEIKNVNEKNNNKINELLVNSNKYNNSKITEASTENIYNLMNESTANAVVINAVGTDGLEVTNDDIKTNKTEGKMDTQTNELLVNSNKYNNSKITEASTENTYNLIHESTANAVVINAVSTDEPEVTNDDIKTNKTEGKMDTQTNGLLVNSTKYNNSKISEASNENIFILMNESTANAVSTNAPEVINEDVKTNKTEEKKDTQDKIISNNIKESTKNENFKGTALNEGNFTMKTTTAFIKKDDDIFFLYVQVNNEKSNNSNYMITNENNNSEDAKNPEKITTEVFHNETGIKVNQHEQKPNIPKENATAVLINNTSVHTRSKPAEESIGVKVEASVENEDTPGSSGGGVAMDAPPVQATSAPPAGDILPAHEFPWMVLVLTNGKFVQGGVLISDRHVLTTATPIINAAFSSLRVVLGVHDHCSDSTSSTLAVQEVVHHPDYTSGLRDHDLALLKMNAVLRFDQRIHPVCMPFSAFSYRGEVATVVSWGAEPHCLPRRVRLPTLTRDECVRSSEGRPASASVTADKSCLGVFGAKSTVCASDVGAPVQYQNRDGKYELLGLVVDSGVACDVSNSTLFVRISDHLGWLYKVTLLDCFCSIY